MLGFDEHKSPAAMRAENREAFIARRTVEEQGLSAWVRTLLSIPKDILQDKLSFNLEDLTLPKLIPEWYEEHGDRVMAKTHLAEANAKIAEINKIMLEVNKDAYELTKEYNALIAGVPARQ